MIREFYQTNVNEEKNNQIAAKWETMFNRIKNIFTCKSLKQKKVVEKYNDNSIDKMSFNNVLQPTHDILITYFGSKSILGIFIQQMLDKNFCFLELAKTYIKNCSTNDILHGVIPGLIDAYLKYKQGLPITSIGDMHRWLYLRNREGIILPYSFDENIVNSLTLRELIRGLDDDEFKFDDCFGYCSGFDKWIELYHPN